MKTYLITGGAGFIGSTLADKLVSLGNEVVIIDNFNDYYDVNIKENNVKHHLNNPLYHLYRIDLCEEEEVNEVFDNHKIDVVIHLAARAGVRPSIDEPILYQMSNNVSTNILLEAARKHCVNKLVLASSSSVYGNNKKVPFSEDDPVDRAISPYAASKKANEVLGHVYHHLYNMNMIFLRFFTVYGPRQRPDLAINKFTRAIREDKEINLFGDGTTSRDYTYIDDIVSGIIGSINYLFEHENVYEIINLGGDEPITLMRMVHTIEEALGKKAIIKYLPMQPGDVDRTCADISKARRLLGYDPKTSFEEGIRKYIEWSKEVR